MIYKNKNMMIKKRKKNLRFIIRIQYYNMISRGAKNVESNAAVEHVESNKLCCGVMCGLQCAR